MTNCNKRNIIKDDITHMAYKLLHSSYNNSQPCDTLTSLTQPSATFLQLLQYKVVQWLQALSDIASHGCKGSIRLCYALGL